MPTNPNVCNLAPSFARNLVTAGLAVGYTATAGQPHTAKTEGGKGGKQITGIDDWLHRPQHQGWAEAFGAWPGRPTSTG